MPISIQSLEDLEKLDLQLADLLTIKTTSPLKLAECEKQVGLRRQTFQIDEEKLKKLKADLQKQQDRIDEENRHIKRRQDRLSEIRNDKEYKAALREIEGSKAEISNLEEDIEVLTERIKHQEEVCQKTKVSYDEEVARFAEEKSAIETKLVTLETQLGTLQQQRADLARAIPGVVISKYDRVRRRKKTGSILMGVTTGSCSHCHMAIAPQRFNELRRGEDVLICDSCQMVLYWKSNA